jgi:hypothetical protein
MCSCWCFLSEIEKCEMAIVVLLLAAFFLNRDYCWLLLGAHCVFYLMYSEVHIVVEICTLIRGGQFCN